MGSFITMFLSQPDNPEDYIDYSSYVDDVEEMPTNSINEELQHVKDCQQDDPCDEVDNHFDSATDAVSASNTEIMPTINLTLDNVLFVEEQLDLYEKVSLVYLLYDDCHLALQKLNELLNGGSQKLLYSWAVCQNQLSQKWKEKFIEAICIIQNYQVLKMLGYQRKDLIIQFLPHHMFTVLYVNKIRKALYFLSESLMESETQKVLELVLFDFHKKGLEFKMYNSFYLELSLLHWESVGYIKQDDLCNLYSVLKQLEYFELVDKLKSIIPPVVALTIHNEEKIERNKLQGSNKTVDANENKKKSSKIFEEILNGDSSLFDLSSMDSVNAKVNVNDYYTVDPENPGICLIINQEVFYTEIDPQYKKLLPPNGNKLESRLGTQKDKEELEATFKMFGFKTEVVDNLTHKDIKKKIQEVILSVTNESSLFICIMSHGHEGVIYGVNSCRVMVKEIKSLMCSSNQIKLLGKPKVLILQSCQGTRCQKVSCNDYCSDITTDSPSPTNSQEKVPPLADLCTFWATVPGYGAIRNKKTGSWFIQSLCDKMKELGNKCHFLDICTAVIDDVSRKIWSTNEGDVSMVPLKEETWRKRFYLPSIKNNSNSNRSV